MSISFIGCGNMAGAIIRGILSAKAVMPKEVFAFDTDTAKADQLEGETGICICESASDAAVCGDYIVLAVKPNVIKSVIKEIDPALQEQKTIVSIAAGKTIAFIESCFSEKHRIIRVMPNINAKVSAACSAFCANDAVQNEDKEFVKKIFGAVGEITELPESSFPLFGVIAGCVPAFAYMFIDAIARAGVENGMSKSDALKFSAQAVLGSAKMVLESDAHPYELIDRVCSPGGTTIEGVISLQADGFESAVHNAVNKAVEKDRLL